MQLRKKKKTKQVAEFLNQDVHKVIFGPKVVISMLGFTVGGMLVGRTLWEYMRETIAFLIIISIGLIIFIISGINLRSFRK